MNVLLATFHYISNVKKMYIFAVLHLISNKIFFHPAKFDNFKDEKISDFKTVSVSQRKNLLD